MVSKLDISWTPLRNKFITWTYDTINLYEIKPTQEAPQNAIKISKTTSADIIACVNNLHYLKCLDIHPKSEKDLFLALGFSNGKIRLSTFGELEWDSKTFSGRELVPKYSRQCNTVEFNPVENNLLATSFDKYKPDHCIAIWDINQVPSSCEISTFQSEKASPGTDNPKPLWEFGMAEHCQTIVWFHNNCKILAAGMNLKHIKLFDIRESPRLVSTTLTKAAFGICANPKDDKYLASYFENQVFIWDTRNMEKPIQVLTQNRPVAKLAWNPIKSCRVTSLLKDSGIFYLFDIEHPIIGSEQVEPTVLERIVNPKSTGPLASFCWHPTDDNRILSVGPGDRNIIIDHQLYDRITVNCTPWFQIVWSHGKKVLKSLDHSTVPAMQDIAVKMKDRAKEEYGLAEELCKNANIVKNDEVLSNVWNWLDLCLKLVEENQIVLPAGFPYKHPGVMYILNIDPDRNPSETVTVSWNELGHANCSGTIKYYKHDDRNNALLLCSWPIERDTDSLSTIISSLERAGAYTRAAALAVFNLNVPLAIEILGRAPASFNSAMVILALSGFSDDPNSVWKRFCTTSIHSLTDPYLKAMFGFLAGDNNYHTVLYESDITVDDKVALACVYLADNKLKEYMSRLAKDLCKQGNLDGLLLTGNSPEGLKLLEKYNNNTGDIQSTTLIAVRAFHNEINSVAVLNWILNYRNLLNTWKLWFQRCDFDIMVAKYKKDKPPPQIYVSCNYCGKNISAHMRNLRTQQYSRLNVAGTSNKLTACPHCRKPLPRCTVCLMNMGEPVDDEDSDKPRSFDSWFAWCQYCRHGGHAKHITNWFAEHVECPQVGCTCRCFRLDQTACKN